MSAVTPDTISLSVIQTQMTEPYPYVEASSALFVNGKPLFKGTRPCVDSLLLVTRGTIKGEMSLLTCSCGVAECAGFFEDVLVRADDKRVHWSIPVGDSYEKAMQDHWGEGPWHFCFEREQLSQVLHKHEQELLALEKQLGALALFPWEPFEDKDVPPPLTNLFKRARGLHLEEGDLDDVDEA